MKPLIQTLYKIQKTALEANPAFMKAKAAYLPEPGLAGPIKYADYERFLPGFISSMGEFGLLEEILGDKKLCVLDIGTGPGYTPHYSIFSGMRPMGWISPIMTPPRYIKSSLPLSA